MSEDARLTRIHRLFEAVQDVPPAHRPEALRDLCEDESVRDEVLGLFAHDDDEAMAGVHAIVSRALSFTPDGPPTIPGIELQDIIGAGAMGVVYRGLQTQPRRPVAVKVLRSIRPSDGMVRRFRAESEALGRLRHPGIATVYQAGMEESGGSARPYLVMELADGVPLDEWIKAHRPGVRRILELCERVCDAVQHAHSRGVIHRDIKPRNILVSAAGTPKLVDFGVARLIDPSATLCVETLAGEMVGTLAYMSPEQFSGDPEMVDTRSDVYALGVLLFSMLTGELPHEFTTLSIAEAARTIESEQPKRLVSIRPDLRGDIDTIVAHALEKYKDRRYQTAAAFGEDIRRHLDGLPINARQPSTLYILGRMARRHRPLVIAGTLALLALGIGAAWSVRGMIATRRALEAANRSNERIESINEFLIVDMLRAGQSDEQGPKTRIIDVVDRAVPKIADRFADDPIGGSRVRQAMAQLLAEAGRLDEAVEQLAIAHDNLVQAGRAHSPEAVDVLLTLSTLQTTRGQPDLGEAAARAAIEIGDQIGLGESDPLWAKARGQLASTLQSQGKLDEALALLGLVIDRQLADGPPYPREILMYLSYQYQAGLQSGWDDQRLTRIADQLVRIGESFPDPASRITTANFDAWRHERAGNAKAGFDARLRELAIARAEFEPGSAHYINAVVNAAGAHAIAGGYADAERLMLEARQLYIDHFGFDHFEVERMARYLSRLYQESGDTENQRRWRIESLIMRFYVAGPGEMESLERAVLDAKEAGLTELDFIARLTRRIEDDRRTGRNSVGLTANVGRLLAARDDPAAVVLLSEALDTAPTMDPDRRPGEIVDRVGMSLPGLLRRLGRDEQAAEIESRVERLRAAFATPG